MMAASRIHNPSLEYPVDYSNMDSILNTVVSDENPADLLFNRASYKE